MLDLRDFSSKAADFERTFVDEERAECAVFQHFEDGLWVVIDYDKPTHQADTVTVIDVGICVYDR